MIDLHSHLLYGVDDGADSLQESLALARIAVEDGIKVTVLTPHIHPRRYPNVRSRLLSRVEVFQDALKEHGIPLVVRLGAEVRLSIESLELIAEGEIPFLGKADGFRIMLLEFPHEGIPVGSQQFIDKLLQLNIRPLIAHPERNKAVMAQPERIRAFVDAGCWLQLTAASVCGQFGETARKTANHLLENDWVHVIGTDAHNVEHRPPILSTGRIAAAAIVGEKKAWQLVRERPARILGVKLQ